MRQDHEPSSGYLWLKTKGASVSLTSQWGGNNSTYFGELLGE